MHNRYTEQGFPIFPCNSDKTPMTKNGFRDASTEWPGWHGELIGLVTGSISGIVVIDLDTKGGWSVDDLLETLKEWGPVPDTFTVETPSNGRHLYYKVEHTNLSSYSEFFKKDIPIDIRANGGYVIAPDDKNYYAIDNNIDYLLAKCAPLPYWIENFKKPTPSNGNGNGKGHSTIDEDERAEIRSALNYVDSDDRDMWVRVGMCLKSTGDKAARGIWDEWSQKSEKFEPIDQSKKWATFKPSDISVASIFFEAKRSGWESPHRASERLTKEVLCHIDEPEPEKNYAEKKPFPAHLLTPPGVVGDIVQYMNFKSIKNQPILSLSAALAAFGTLAVRKVQTDTGIRTNIYCIGVGESGCGKEAARKVIKELFHHAGCGAMASVEDLASDASIVTAMDGNPSQIFLLDEIGRFLRVTNSGKGTSPHLSNIISVLLKMYSNADTMFYGKKYADKERNQQIDNPNLCIYGTTVPSVLYEGLTLENVNDGFLSRVLMFESEDPDPPKDRRKNFIGTPPEDLINKLKHMRDKQTNPHGGLSIMPQAVGMTNGAEEMIIEFDTEIYNLRKELREDHKHDNIYNRTSQIAEQIALIVASGVDMDKPEITEIEMNYGIELSRHLSDNLLYIVENYIAANEQEHNVNKVLSIIKKAEGGISMSQITRKTQSLQGYVRADIIDTLVQGGRVSEILEGDGKKKRRIFHSI